MAQVARSVPRLLATMLGNNSRSVAKLDWTKCQPMVYPYTMTAKLIQQDWIFFYKQCMFPRYYLYANIICFPLWAWITFQGKSHCLIVDK